MANIICTISNCKYNNPAAKACSLDEIKIGTHEAMAHQVECTDCQSFKKRK